MAYDAAGNLICRALTTTATCNGSSSTGQQLTYDAEGRLSFWQNQPTSPMQTVNYLYDGSGTRVAMQSTVNGTMTLTAYIGSIEEVQTSGSSTQTTTYYTVGDKRIAADVNGTFYYFGYDALGSQVAVLNSTGSLVGAQLYGPYGSSRYSTGTLPTSIGFTGQRGDSVTGLDYYVGRYYDPVVGQFLSEDSVQGNSVGMDPYGYVGGNPESYTDPTGYSWSNDGAAIGGSPVDWGAATGGGNGGNVGIGGAALLAAAAAAGSGGSGGGSGSHGGTSAGSSSASNADITDNWAQQLRQLRAYEAKQDRARAAAQAAQSHSTKTENQSASVGGATTLQSTGQGNVLTKPHRNHPSGNPSEKARVGGAIDVVGPDGEILFSADDVSRMSGPNEPPNPNKRTCAEYHVCKKGPWQGLKQILDNIGRDNAKVILRIVSRAGLYPCQLCWPMLQDLSASIGVPVTVLIYNDISNEPIDVIEDILNTPNPNLP